MPQGEPRVAGGARIRCLHMGAPACVIEWRDDLTATCPTCGARYVHALSGPRVDGGLELVIRSPQAHQPVAGRALTFDALGEAYDRIDQHNRDEEERYARMQEAEL